MFVEHGVPGARAALRAQNFPVLVIQLRDGVLAVGI